MVQNAAEVANREQSYGYGRGEPMIAEKQRFPVEDGRSRTLPTDAPVPARFNPYQQSDNQRRENLMSPAAPHQPPAPMQSQHAQSSSVPARQTDDNRQFAGPRTPREDPRHQLSASLDGSDPRWTADFARSASSQPRPTYHQRDVTTPAGYDQSGFLFPLFYPRDAMLM